jgi:hypothetical protein
MVMQKYSHSQGAVDLGDKFRGRLAGGVQQGMPFVIELTHQGARILSEVVVAVEIGCVPEMLFR